ncbi:MATE family efflux transporter, partial [Dechloromonas sp.]|uniref:MATE family efflux transporter n=1 Tax=Dechloromonas sp. TaxID=1917218 RepID=UPI00216C736D
FRHWQRPDGSHWRTLLRLGLPMGFSNLVEITAFTLVALFIAALGAEVVAGHRIVANLAALAYMLPLSLAIATLSLLGQAVGARDWPRAHELVKAGMLLAGVTSSLLGLLLWWLASPIVAAYTDDPAVRAVAVSLVGYVAAYQFFDALQTVASHALRAYRVTFVPMLIQVFCFWGIGLLGGWWLCWRGDYSLGVQGFWLASVLSLVAAAGLLGPLLRKTVQATESTL